MLSVNWDGGGDGSSWSDPLNWSSNLLPGAADDVIIDVPAAISVTYASGTTTIRSLTSAENLTLTGGTLVLTNGPSSVGGSLSVGAATLRTTGATTVFNATGPTTLTRASLSALAGSKLNLPLATAYAEGSGGSSTIEASSTSQIDLSGVTSVTGSGGPLFVKADTGGIVNLSSVTTWTARQTQVFVTDASSKVVISSLTSMTDAAKLSAIGIQNGGTLDAAALTTLDGVGLGLTGTGWSVPVSQLTSVTNGRVSVFSASATFSALTNVNGTTLQSGGTAGSILTLPAVTSFAGQSGATVKIEADGGSNRVNLPSMTSLVAPTSAIDVNAINGGRVDLPLLSSIPGGDIDLLADGASSLLRLPQLTSWVDTTGLSDLQVKSAGTLEAPLLTQLKGVDVDLGSGGWNMSLGQITSLANSSLDVNGGLVLLADLTNADGAQLGAFSGCIMVAPLLFSYAKGSGLRSFSASGAGSLLDVNNLSSITSAPDNLWSTLSINATAGGALNLRGLAALNAGKVAMRVDDANSLIQVDALASWNDETHASRLDVQEFSTLDSPLLTTFNGVSINFSGSGWTMPLSQITQVTYGEIAVSTTSVSIPNLTDLTGTSLFTNTLTAVLDLPGVVSYNVVTVPKLRFSAASGILRLQNLVTISGAGTVLSLDSSSGMLSFGSLSTITAAGVRMDISGDLYMPVLAHWEDATNNSFLILRTDSSTDLTGGTLSVWGVEVALSDGISVSGGTLELNGSSKLTGYGQIHLDIVNRALVLPGADTPFLLPPNRIAVEDYQQTAEGTLRLYVVPMDDALTVDGTVTLAGSIDLVPTTTLAMGQTRVQINNDAADPVVGQFANAPEGAILSANGMALRISYTGGTGNDVTLTRVPNAIVGRRLFYNQSKYDQNSAAAGPADDGAIATDKQALRPGQTATFANVSSYARGINGVMIDLAGTHGTLSASDFIFRQGNNNTPSAWAAAVPPSTVVVRSGAGAGGSDRIELIWPDHAVEHAWLQIVVLANANTGLAQSATLPVGQADTFLFGNIVGDAGLGNTSTSISVNTTDELAVRNHPASPFQNIPATNPYDFNRDGAVNTSDSLITRNHVTNAGTVLRLLSLSNPPAAPIAMDGSELAPVASALATAIAPPPPASAPRWLATRLATAMAIGPRHVDTLSAALAADWNAVQSAHRDAGLDEGATSEDDSGEEPAASFE